MDETLKGREIKPAVELLEKAGVIHRVRHSPAKACPLEVKSGKSMVQFLKEKPNAQYGVHLSLDDFGRFSNILRLPLWAVWKVPDYPNPSEHQ